MHMNDDRVERLLRGYRLPEVPHGLDQRVLAEAERILARARGRATLADIARGVGDAFGFGYVNVVVDLVTATDAEYRVDLI
jgi:hypothetical protein